MNLVEYFLVDKSEEKECTIYHVIYYCSYSTIKGISQLQIPKHKIQEGKMFKKKGKERKHKHMTIVYSKKLIFKQKKSWIKIIPKVHNLL